MRNNVHEILSVHHVFTCEVTQPSLTSLNLLLTDSAIPG